MYKNFNYLSLKNSLSIKVNSSILFFAEEIILKVAKNELKL